MVTCDQFPDLTEITNRDFLMDAEQLEDSSITLPHNLTYTISSNSDSSLQSCAMDNSSVDQSQYTSQESDFSRTSTKPNTPCLQRQHRKKPINSLKLARQRSKSKMVNDVCTMTPNTSYSSDVTSTRKMPRRYFSKSLARRIQFTKKNKCNS